MPWIQIIILLIQILREVYKDKSKSTNALTEAGFTVQDNTWRKKVTIKKRKFGRKKATDDIDAEIIYIDGKFTVNESRYGLNCHTEKTREFDTFDDFEKYILQLRKQ